MPDTPFVRIVWNNCTIGEWNELLHAVARSTITQTFAYGEAMLLTERWQPRFGLIEANDRPVGLVLVLEKRVAKVVRVAKIHRGPLWLVEPEPAVLAAALKALRLAFPAGITRWTTFVPELPAGEAARAMLKAAGFRPMKGEGYRTLWL
ncbi:MAG TPA: GNAT family N-acetyltransferase, partial [Azospirillaceae bacterium]|nr:GNAT family N-acetyltransferase [Azospirillaceae bacterium]